MTTTDFLTPSFGTLSRALQISPGRLCYIRTVITSAKEVMFLPDFVCLSVCLCVCVQDNSKSYGRIFRKF